MTTDDVVPEARAGAEHRMHLDRRVTEFSDYKDYLRYVISAEPRGAVRNLADAAGCQRSYLSQVLHTHINLTVEQLFGMASYLALTAPETDYFMLLLERDKAARPQYRRHIESRLAKAREDALLLADRLKAKNAPTRNLDAARYYSSWHYAALHIATALPHLKSDDDFARSLQLPLLLVSNALRELESWGLITYRDRKWSYCTGSEDLHLDSRSPLWRVNNMNWRILALSRPQSAQHDLHYSAVFAIGREDYNRIREDLVRLIAAQRTTIAASPSEELCLFCCDLASLTRS